MDQVKIERALKKLKKKFIENYFEQVQNEVEYDKERDIENSAIPDNQLFIKQRTTKAKGDFFDLTEISKTLNFEGQAIGDAELVDLLFHCPFNLASNLDAKTQCEEWLKLTDEKLIKKMFSHRFKAKDTKQEAKEVPV